MAQMVYIFNVLPDPIRLRIEASAPSGAPTTTARINATNKTSKPPYEPGSLQEDSIFINGETYSITIETETSSSSCCTLPIPVTADPGLFLYIFSTFMLLMSNEGSFLEFVTIKWAE